MDLRKYIRDIPDFPKQGIIFKDITPLLNDPKAFSASIRQLVERYKDKGLDKVVGIEARGFIFAGALGYALNIGVVPIRKPGKLPYQTIKETYELEYGTDAMEIHKDAIKRGEKILLMDDVLATGGTLAAAARLVEKLGGEITEIATLIDLTFLRGKDKIKNYSFFSMIEY